MIFCGFFFYVCGDGAVSYHDFSGGCMNPYMSLKK